jgi:SAM-dependent methyltransferase
MPRPEALLAEFGRIDIYLFDQLLRGRITSEMRVLDAGCGGGRNSEYLMRCGAEVFAVDADPDQVARIRDTAAAVAPGLSDEHFQVARLEGLPFPDDHFGAVICSAVLHFSRDPGEFQRSVREMWRVVAPGGMLFARLASMIGMEGRVRALGDGWYRLLDGSDRFLVSEADLMRLTSDLGAVQLDPLKTTVVQEMRSMTTWVLTKPDVVE